MQILGLMGLMFMAQLNKILILLSHLLVLNLFLIQEHLQCQGLHEPMEQY